MIISELRQAISPQNIISILGAYNVYPVVEKENYIIFPTCCHNISGGSHKLYYYTDSCLFHCYTECNCSFDIFELIKKIEKLRNGEDINLWQAIEKAGLQANELQNADSYSDKIQSKIDYMYQFVNTIYNNTYLPAIDESVLKSSVFNTEALSLWELEGITLSTMKKYKIGYNPIANCITIPIFDINGNLISVRGRFLSEEEDSKYKPIVFGNKVLSAPSSQILYGLNTTKNAIKNSKTVVIFESEKSVLMMDSYYGENNNSVATLGQNISNQQIMLLKKVGAEEVIIAYDADYRNEKETQNKFQQYIKIAKNLAPFFSTSILIDWKHLLPYKASPIDCGKTIFEELLKDKYYVKI